MKIEIVKEKLLGAVSLAERISGKHASLPILSSIMMEAKNDQVVIRATNLEVGIELNIPAKVSQEGVVALSGQILKSFLQNTANEKSITLEVKDGAIFVVAGGSRATIKTVPSEDFPSIPKVTEGNEFSLQPGDFIYGIKSVWQSASLSSLKPELSSIYIYPDKDDLIFVATDSFRLSEKKVKVKKAKDAEQMLIPFKNVIEIVRVLETVSGDIIIRTTKNQLSITASGLHITSRVVDGNFPDYKQILPKEFTTKATVLKEDLMQSLKLTSAFSDSFNQTFLSVSVSKKYMEVKTKNNDIGEGSESMKGAFEGQDISMTFNHRYVSDALQSIEGESVLVNLVGVGKPMLLRGQSDSSFIALVMPMNK